MTEFFNYDELTWPDVAALPRDVPLILPLGSGYDLGQLASSLFNPPRIGLLPAFPFGWRGSGLELPKIILGRYVGNLITNLREDGFTRAFCLTPQTADQRPYFQLPKPNYQIALPVSETTGAQPILPPDSERGKVILMPIGHTEQHGFHLPLSVDTHIIDAIARGTAAQAPARAFTLPVMPYGVSTHRPSFAGTLSAGGRTFEDFWLGVIDVLVARGFDRFYLMSGHGGNTSFLVNIVKYAGERYRRIFCATAFLHTSGAIGVAALEKYRTSPIGGMGHACELETSFMLHLHPELCHMERVVNETDFISTPSFYMDWIEGGSLIANPPWDDDTRTGAYATFMTQNWFLAHVPAQAFGFYFLAAIPLSCIAAGAAGFLLERGVIRFLYGRPLETLLATWGVSLILIQAARFWFGDLTAVAAPSWLSGGIEVISGVQLPYNRLFIIAFTMVCVAGVYLLLLRSSAGLRIRAVMQNRAMSASMGIPTDRVDAWTFALGSGLAGMAGCALTLIGNVEPDLGQNYIVDAFIVVVTGGVGKLAGTVAAALGIGWLNTFLELVTDSAVMGKVLILVFVILFLQRRPSGLFPPTGRAVEY